MDALGAATNFFDLSANRGDVISNLQTMSGEERKKFLSVTATLLKQGVVGRETVKVDGHKISTDATARLGDERLRHAKVQSVDEKAVPILDAKVDIKV